MNSFDSEVFEFGTNPNEESENFNYSNISGLGESNYENEDLFGNISPLTNTVQDINNNFNDSAYGFDYNLTSDNSLKDLEEKPVNADSMNNIMENITEQSDSSSIVNEVVNTPNEVEQTSIIEPVVDTSVEQELINLPELEEVKEESIEETIVPKEDTINEEINIGENNFNKISLNDVLDFPTVEVKNETPKIEEIETKEEKSLEMSDTPIEELQKLTEYKEEKIESTDINSLFDKLSVNVKDASEIFRKNTNLKEKIDSRFDELKALQGELENSRRKQIEEIDKYRNEVLDKLSEKKTEIEKRLNILKDLQATLEKEKTEFEEYKRKEQSNISKVKKEVQSAYDERREELEHIEDVLRKQKDSLDEERNQLSLDKIQYEADKNDLANNLLKFNQIVNSFTNGIEMKNEE